MPLQLKIRRLQSGETLIAEFESVADAETWLRERPKFVDVLGTVGGLGESVDKRLRAAMRPFDDDELGLVAQQDAIAAESVRRAMEEREQELANADPGRLMHVAWDHESGMHNGEAGDTREIPEVVREAVLAWVAGFDMIYACQDVDFDRTAKLHSVPVRLGVAGALRLAAGCHFATIVALAALPLVYPPFGWVWWTGIAAVAVLLIYEHALVRPDDLTRVNAAFFHVNAVISLGLLAVGLADLLITKT